MENFALLLLALSVLLVILFGFAVFAGIVFAGTISKSPDDDNDDE
jgi:hypothetical protein